MERNVDLDGKGQPVHPDSGQEMAVGESSTYLETGLLMQPSCLPGSARLQAACRDSHYANTQTTTAEPFPRGERDECKAQQRAVGTWKGENVCPGWEASRKQDWDGCGSPRGENTVFHLFIHPTNTPTLANKHPGQSSALWEGQAHEGGG